VRAIIDAIRLRPKHCVWELTPRCNMRCLHCASDLGEGRTRGDILSLEESLSLCHELADLGCENVVLSGGEALLSEDWEPIARELVSLGINVSLISNGFLIDEAKAVRIRDAGLCRVALSLDGPEPTHNYIRCNPRAFERVWRAFDALKAAGLQVNIVTHVNRMNLGELPALEALMAERRVDVWRLQLGSPVGRMARHRELLIEPDELPAVAKFIVAAKRRGKVYISVGDNVGYFSDDETELRRGAKVSPFPFWCGCSAGCLTVGIESNGNVKGCLSLQADRFIEGNVREEPLSAIWQKPGAFAYTRDFGVENLHGGCAECEFGEICRGGCTFMAYGATGSPHDNPYCLYRVEKAKHANATPLPAGC
jgi:radical SAM protein with 4Fe4S-binding SPASM domain